MYVPSFVDVAAVVSKPQIFENVDTTWMEGHFTSFTSHLGRED